MGMWGRSREITEKSQYDTVISNKNKVSLQKSFKNFLLKKKKKEFPPKEEGDQRALQNGGTSPQAHLPSTEN